MGHDGLIHTLVLHLYPDLEAIGMAWLCQDFSLIRSMLGIAETVALKFIPAGALRPEDWDGLPQTAAALTRRGYLFLDCGGGYFDQHMHPEEPETSSLDRLVQETRLLQTESYLTSFVRLISRNDVRATAIVSRPHYRAQGRPLAVPHLRTLIEGWNLLHRRDHDEVYRLAALGFQAVLQNLLTIAEERVGRGLSEKEISIRGLDLFMLPAMRKGLRAYQREQYRAFGAEGEQEAQRVCHKWEQEADRALSEVEAQWRRGSVDFQERAEVRKIGVGGRTLKVVVGTSDSHRFGAYARWKEQPDVLLQFRSDGKFTLNSRGQPLHQAGRAVWQADLQERGLAWTERLDAVISGIQSPSGPPESPERLFYLFPSGTLFGNWFRSNPFMPRSTLAPDRVVDLVLRNLGRSATA